MEELEAIIQRMIDAGEPEENIKTVIEGYEVEDVGFDPTRYVPGVAGDILTGPLYAYEKILQAGQGLTNIADNLIKNIETGQEPEWLTRKLAQMSVIGASPKAVEAVVKDRKKVFDIYTNHVVDMVQQGASRKLIQETDPTNVVKLEPLINWFERTLPAPKIDKETGEAVDYLKLYGDGKIIEGTDAFMSDVAGAVPSILISRIPVLGPTLLGASTYMGEFEDELIKRAKDPEFNLEEDLDNLIQNALITGGADVVLETVGGSLLNKIPGMQLGKETVKEILTEAPKQLLKKSGLGFLSEFATEGATGVVTDLADVVSFGDDVKPVKDYLRTFVKDGFVGGFLGGTVTSVGGIQNRNKIYEYVSPQTYKQEQLGLSSSILTLEQDKQKASSKDKKYFDTKIQELKNKKESNQKNLYTFFDNSTEKEKVEYASNIDKQNEALDVIGNKNFSELAQQEAEQDLRKYTEANNKFFDVTDVDYDAGLEQEIGLKIKAAQRIAEKRGAFGFDNKNLNVVELNTAEEVKEVASKIPGADTADGIFLGESKDGKSTIYINNPVAIAKGSTNVLGHEYLHAIISKAFKTTGIGNENLSVAAKSFVDYLNSIGEQRIVERVEKRLADNYGGLDADGNIVRDENGLVKTDKKQDQEEYFNLFSDLISKEKIKRVEEKSGGIKNAFRQLMTGLGFSKVDFKNGKQVFDFLVDYNANMEKSGITGRLLSKRIAKTKMTGLEATAAEKAAMDQIKKESRTGYEKTARDQRIDAIGEQSTKTEWDAGGADMAISDMYMSGDLEAIVRNNLSSDLKNLPNYSEEDFISETIGELMPHIKNFNIDKKETQKGFGLSGWIRGQISNKIGNVLKKKKATTETFTVDTTDEKVKETVEATDALEDLQEEDISISAQAKKKAKAERREEKGMEADVEYSTFRRALKVKGKQGLSDNIVNDVKKAVVKTMATERTTPDSDKFIANIKKSFLTELKKPIQDMMGKKDDFTDFLKTNREAIISALPTSTLVQMERNVNPEDRTFTVEIKRNLSPTETDDAIANDQLPKDTNRNSGPTLYAKRMPSEGEFLRYFNPPLYVPSKKDPNKFVRSGLKGTRKDTLAEQMGIELAFDATMEVVQSPEVAERRSLVTNTDFLETGLDQLARSIGRGIDIKFSRSNPVEIEFKMDLALDNVNTDAYLDIRFSKSSRDAYIKRLVKNRPDLKGKEEQYVDSVFDWLETTNIKKRSKYEKMAMHYMAKGYLILPEDGYKVIEAERLAAIKKIDPFSVGNPNEIIEKYAGTVKGARTNPDTVKEFSNKKDLGNGIVTYDVEQTKEGQLAVREVIDTHFGKKSNPWCLASRDNRLEQAYAEFNNKEQANIKARELESQGYDVEVALIDGTYEVYGDLIAKPGNDMELNAAFTMWEKYQEGGKGYQVVFTNGKLSHFKDGSGKYWDKMDEPSNYISKKLSDLKLKDGFTQERYLNVNTGEQVLGDKSRVTGNRQDGTYTETTIKSTPTFGETVEIEEVRKNGELTYQKKLTTNNDESYGTETKYYKDSKTVTNTKSHPKGLKKGGSPLWALETTLDRAGKIAGVDLKLDKYTETSLVNDYKGTTTGSYNRVGSKHTVKGELNGKNATVEIFQSVGVNEDTNIAKVKVNGKTVYTAPKVDDIGVKFSKSKFEPTRSAIINGPVEFRGINNAIIFNKDKDVYQLRPEVRKWMRQKSRGKVEYPTSEVLGYFVDLYNDMPANTQLDLSLQKTAIGTGMGRLSKLLPYSATKGHLFEAVIARYGYNTLKSVQPGITIISKYQAAKKLGTTPSKLPDIVLWDGKDKWESADSLFTVEAKFDNSRAGGVTITDYKFKDFTPNNTKVLNKYDSLDKTGEVINETWKQNMLKQFSKPLANFVKEAEALGTKIVDSKTQVPIGVHNALKKAGNSFLGEVMATGEVKADQIVNYYNNGDFKPVKSDVIAHASKGAFTLGVDPHGLYANGILPKLAGDYQVTMRLKTNVSKNKEFVTYTPILEIEFRSSDIKGEYADGRKVDASDLKLQNKKDFEKVLKNVKGFKLSKSQSTSKAMDLGQLTNKDTEAVGMSTFDFDETLVIDGENFITATKGDDVVKITSSQWPLVGDTYASEGYTFDFSDFVNVRGGVDGPLLQKMKNQISKYGVKNVFVLTARPAESATAIQGWLESKGINIPLNNITGLGNSSGDAKAQWMLDKFAEGYNDMYFVDDALPNVEAVKNVLDQLDVKGKSVQATVRFSKSIASTLSKNKSYNKFKDSLAESVLYHGGLNSLKNKNAVWFIVDDVDGAELYADVRGVEGEVYSVKASQLKNSIIIPDMNDSLGFDKVIKQKFPDQYEALVNSDSQVKIESVLKQDNAAEIISEYISWADSKFELFEGVYGPEKGLYDNAGKIAKTLPVIVLNTDVSSKARQVKPSTKFSKSSLRKNKAVQNVLDQLDIKSNVQQAKIKFSKDAQKSIKDIIANAKINEMIERSKGIPAQEIISGAGARRSGKNKNPFQFFVPPSADDLSGLLYYLAGKGKQGEADLKFMKQFLLDPLGKGERSLATKKQQIITDYKELKKELTDTHKKLKTLIPDSKYTYDTAVRVFLWNQEGYDIPDISDKEVGQLVAIVNNDTDLQEYAQKLASIGSNYEGKYPEPIEDWIVGSTAKDLYDVTTKVGRKLFLSEFSENSNAFFTKDNINKLTAAYGVEYTEALKDMLYRIKTGENRPKSISEGDRNTKRFMNWVTNSTGAIMFFNSRSAVLQTLSTVNYLNWSDNNPLLAGKAFANQKQFWTDFAMIFNSDMLKQRRSGLSTDIQAAEIASAAATAKNKANAAIAYLLKKGFLPTQMADSFAISAGGATFYRNRVNSYLKQGMDQKAAEEKAFADFADITEENQQSSRPDRVSQQQASPLGRLILAFQNTPMQYNRIIKKAMLDLQSGRGDTKTNVSKIIYYAGAQAFVFASLQNALFAMLFDDEDEDKSREEILKETEKEQLKLTRVINSMIDGLLNGSGVKGRVMSTIKNSILKFIEEDKKDWNANYTKVAIEAAQLSPPIGSKLRKIAKAGENYGWNKKVIKEIGYDNYFNPAYVTAATFAEAATNVPLARVVRKLDNLVDAADQNNRAWQRIGLLMGWSQWDMGIEGKRRQTGSEVKEEIKKKKKEKKKEEREAKEKRCSAIKSNGKRCKNITTNESGRCYAHD